MAQQLQHYYALVPMAVSGNLFNGLVIGVYARDIVAIWAICAWWGSILAVSYLRLRARRNFDPRAQERELRRRQCEAITLAAILGVAWAGATNLLLTLGAANIAVPAMVGAGMMSAAASTLNVMPSAALAFISPLAVGAGLGFAKLDSADGLAGTALLISYCFVLARSINSYHAQFVARIDHEFDLVEYSSEIEQVAHYDTLTNLPNRILFQQGLERELRDSRLRDSGVAVLNVDLDRFKEVNDTLGHSIGDLLLRAVAENLRQCVPSPNMIARFGGDEFCVLLDSAGGKVDVEAVAERIVGAVRQPYLIEGHAIVIGASVGIASAPRDGATMERLLKCADLAMYRAKARGGGRAVWFAPEFEEALIHKRRLEMELREALSQNQFAVHYQPIIDMRDGRIKSCEALLRWRHPQRGMVSPAEFLSVAEETGQIVALGEWILRQACRDANSWPADIRVAVNLAPEQFQQSDVVAIAREALADSGLPANRLEVEITESTLMLDTKDVAAQIDALGRLGVRISLDDFGTGYSSLSYLHRFPVKKLKIDRSFIEDSPHSSKAQTIVGAISSLARELDIDVVAEGVETHEQLACVATKNVFLVQGYLFSRPKPLEELFGGKPAVDAAPAWRVA